MNYVKPKSPSRSIAADNYQDLKSYNSRSHSPFLSGQGSTDNSQIDGIFSNHRDSVKMPENKPLDITQFTVTAQDSEGKTQQLKESIDPNVVA